MANEKETQELECAVKEVKREYYREYRKKNKERINENNRRYWERKALKRLQDSEGLCPKCASALEKRLHEKEEKK